MADPRVTEWTDAVLGRLTWDDEEHVWVGRADVGGRQIRLEIDPARKQPNREQQLAAIQAGRQLLARVRAAEPELRRHAAVQIGAAAKAPQSEIDRFATTLILEVITLHGSGEAHDHNDEFLRGWKITVFFDENVSNVEAEAYEA